jgi:hypothetical protein
VAQTYNIHIDQGSTYTLTVEYIDAVGAAVDLTNYEARMQVRETVASTTILASFTSSPAVGLVITPPPTLGKVVLTITSAQTAAYTFTNGVYDLEVFDASIPPAVVRLLQGRFVVNPEVTR